MNDTAGTAAPAPAAKAKRESKGDHAYLNSAGAVVESIEEATGISYKDVATGDTFTYQIPGAEAGKVVTMFAIFGAKTRATNAASAARQKRDRDASYLQSDVDYVTETFGETTDGTWAIAGEGARAPSYDDELLADVIVELIEASGKTQDRNKVVDKLKNDKKYRAGAIANPQIKSAYFAKVGRDMSIDALAVD